MSRPTLTVQGINDFSVDLYATLNKKLGKAFDQKTLDDEALKELCRPLGKIVAVGREMKAVRLDGPCATTIYKNRTIDMECSKVRMGYSQDNSQKIKEIFLTIYDQTTIVAFKIRRDKYDILFHKRYDSGKNSGALFFTFDTQTLNKNYHFPPLKKGDKTLTFLPFKERGTPLSGSDQMIKRFYKDYEFFIPPTLYKRLYGKDLPVGYLEVSREKQNSGDGGLASTNHDINLSKSIKNYQNRVTDPLSVHSHKKIDDVMDSASENKDNYRNIIIGTLLLAGISFIGYQILSAKSHPVQAFNPIQALPLIIELG